MYDVNIQKFIVKEVKKSARTDYLVTIIELLLFQNVSNCYWNRHAIAKFEIDRTILNKGKELTVPDQPTIIIERLFLYKSCMYNKVMCLQVGNEYLSKLNE